MAPIATLEGWSARTGQSAGRVGFVLCAALALLVPASLTTAVPARAVASCSYDGPSATVTVLLPVDGDSATIEKSGTAIALDGTPCGAATVTNTDLVDINGAAGAQTITISTAGGLLAPGATTEASGVAEIEYAVDLGTGTDTVIILNGGGDNTIRLGTAGINLNGDDDADVTLVQTEVHQVQTGAGNDDASGAGGLGTGGAFPTALTLDGGIGHDELTGGDGDDVLLGGPDSDQLDGGAGGDVMDGGTGPAPAYVYYDTRTGDVTVTVDGLANDGEAGEGDNVMTTGFLYIYGGSGNDVLTGAGAFGGDGDDVLTGTDASFESLFGEFGNDTLYGLGGGDTLNGGPNDDLLVPGLGNDTVTGGIGIDTVAYSERTGPVEIHVSGFDWSGEPGDPADPLDDERDGLTGVEDALGGSGPDLIFGSTGNNRLEGGPGSDEIHGLEGDDVIKGGPGADTLDGGWDDDILNGGLFPTADVLDGGPDGSDTADYTGRTVDLVIDLDGVGDDGAPGENDTLTAIENVIGGSANDVITGDASSNLLDGAAGNDDLRAGGGADVLEGGPGIDVLSAGPGDDRLDGGLDADDLTGSSGVDTVDYGGRTANLTVDIDGVADDGAAGETDNVRTTVENIVGGSGIDTLTGSTVDNTLAGGAGADVLIGLAGNDTADYRDHTAAVVVNLDGLVGDGASGEGDRVAADIENLVGGGGSDTLTGNSLPNRLIGGAGADTLNGGGGGDTLHGGLGADVFNGGSGSDTVTYSDSLGSVTADIDGVADDPGGDNVGLDVENLTGGPYADLLTGSPSGNILSGGAGNDTLNGGGGWDTLIGGAGNDQFNGGVGTDTVTYLDHAGPVSVDIDGVSDDGGAGESDNVKTDVEKLVGTAASDTLTGGAGNNTLEGGAGNDVLSGGAGNDTLIGGPGADMLAGGTGTADVASYAERTTTVTVTINGVANDGSAGEMDNVQTDVENVIGGSGADTLEGSTAVNILTGGAGNDILRGLAGNDVLNGLDGIDVLDGGPGSDVMHGNAGSDTVTYAARKANVIVSIDGVANDGEAGEGDNVTTTVEIVTTGSGNDTITGSGVSNILWGNAGNDTFYVDDNVADEVHGGTGTDSADRDPGLDSTFSIEIYL